MTTDEYATLATLAVEAIAKIIDAVRGAPTATSAQDVLDKLTAVHAAMGGARAGEDAELHKRFDTSAP